MFARRNKVLVYFFSVLIFVIAIQIAYPRHMLMPNSSIAGNGYIFKRRQTAINDLGRIGSNLKVTIVTEESTFSVASKDAGLTINTDKTLSEVSDYPLKYRMIPFLIFMPRHSDQYVINRGGEISQEFRTKIDSLQINPINSGVYLAGSELRVNPHRDGFSYEFPSFSDEGDKDLDFQLASDYRIVLNKHPRNAPIDTEKAKRVATTVNNKVKKGFEFKVLEDMHQVDSQEVAEWINVTINEEGSDFSVTYDTQKIEMFIKPLADSVFIPGAPDQSVNMNGSLASFSEGSSGRLLAMGETVESVVQSLESDSFVVEAAVRDFKPDPVVSYSYSRDSHGLQALINQWIRGKGGVYGITLKTVDGSVVASHNGVQKLYPASIYKLFVASIAYQKAQKGEIDLNSTVSTGSSMSRCIELMIVVSDNDCAHAVGDSIGWDSNDSQLRNQGFTDTTLTKLNWMTNSNDVTNWMVDLQNGKLLDANYSEQLKSMLARQIYRKGIPSGSPVGVLNKVGGYGSYVHDSAVVHHPNGPYALTIMTSGGSYAEMADLSRQIFSVMSQ